MEFSANRSWLSLVLVLVTLVLFLSCGEGEVADEDGRASAPRRTPAVRSPRTHNVTSPGPAGGSDAGTVADTVRDVEELRFRVTPDRRQFEVGATVPVRLSLKNATDKSIKLYDPEVSLKADLEFEVRAPDGHKVKVKLNRKIDSESIKLEDIVSLAPNGEAAVMLDLAPTLRSVGEGEIGDYEIRATFRGGYHGGHLSMDVWNRGRCKIAVAPAVRVKLTWPLRLSDNGITPELAGEVSKLLRKVGRDGRPTRKAMTNLAAFGEKLHPILAEKLLDTTARSAERRHAGWNSLFLLRDAGEVALPALDRLPDSAGGPAADMLRKLVLKGGPEDEMIRQILTDAELLEAVSLKYSRSPGPRQTGDTILVTGSGHVRYERETEADPVVREGELSPKACEELFGVLVAEQVWLLAGVRKFGLPGEAGYRLELSRTVDGTEEILWSLDVWETEAMVHNRMLMRVLAAVGGAKLALSR